MGKRQKEVIELLIKYENGLTAKEVACIIKDIEPKHARVILEREYAVYIDRWIMGARGQYEPVYCLHPPPEDCPKPESVIHETLHDDRRTLKQFQAKAAGHYGTSAR